MTELAVTEAYLRPDSQSSALFERALDVMPGGNSRSTVFRKPYPPYVASGHGCTLVDVDGDERVDFVNNYTSLVHGHAHPAVVERVADQLRLGSCFSFPTRLEVELADRIVERLASAERVRFANTGTEAVMLAVRLARAVTGRARLAKFEGCYHGGYDDVAISGTVPLAQLGPRERPTSALERGLDPLRASQVLTLPYNDPEQASALIAEAAPTLAAVIVDPAPNRAGLPAGSKEFLDALRAVTAKHGIVLIFDEVITFRSGRSGLQGALGIEPDLTVLGKIIGGGFPIGAVAGRATIVDELDVRGSDPVPHGGTFNANPVTMAAGIASLDLLDDAAFDHLETLASRLEARLAAGLQSRSRDCQINRVGSVFQVHFRAAPVTDYRSLLAHASTPTTAAVAARLLKRGVVLSPNGLGCVSTPMREEQVDYLVDAVLECVEDELAAGAELAGERR